jgi:hypothetical protein
MEKDDFSVNRFLWCGEYILSVFFPLNLFEMIDLKPKINLDFELIVDFKANFYVVKGYGYVL